ncbi:hypothetical protein H257_01240 [Aphanomyces astaci]|uniref:Serine/threonine-protein phosphatase PGAM5, mitochondrial n=1 Tax=Aphanomyces astaci TaxID=112090 RepID=W4H9I6_APHAT|nr:hypothetical protein H257_01240 [Aphanomyces astaci]ETV87783.1 hypothetical protein H257_01240 [Aphanomyces astaci]RQM10300.1 hypothetical protein B5M09_000088 [Aphanomyces astaci]|eukprot:XP_009822646.1 hypothetical protein H257_01240 [Aphanomyces astaci]
MFVTCAFHRVYRDGLLAVMGRNSTSRSDSYVKEGEVLRASFNSGSHHDTILDKLLKVVPSRSPSGSYDDNDHSRGSVVDSSENEVYDLPTFENRGHLMNNLGRKPERPKKAVTFASELEKVEWVAELQYKCPEKPLPLSLFGTRRVIGYEEEEHLLAPSWSKALPYSAVDFGCYQMQLLTREKAFFVISPVQIHHITCMGVSWKTYWAGLSSGLIVFCYEDDNDQVFACPIHKCRVQVLDDTQLKLFEVAGLREVDELFLKFPNSSTMYMWFWAIQIAAATPLYSDTDAHTKALRRFLAKSPPMIPPASLSNNLWSNLSSKLGLKKPLPTDPVVTLPFTLRNPTPQDHFRGLSPPSSSSPSSSSAAKNQSGIQRRLLFIRHAEFNNVHFKTADVEKNITDSGEAAARRTGQFLQDLIEAAGLTYQDVQLVYSTITRTIQTMDIIAKEVDKAAGVYETYNPYDTQSSKVNRVARHELALLRESVPHGLSTSKKFQCRSAKMALALQTICMGEVTYPITVVICSSSFIRYCVHQAAYGVGFIGSRGEMNHSIGIGHCSVTQIDVDQEYALHLRGVNQMAHLAGYSVGQNPQEAAAPYSSSVGACSSI